MDDHGVYGLNHVFHVRLKEGESCVKINDSPLHFMVLQLYTGYG